MAAADRDNEYARTRLRQKMRRVDRQRAESIAEALKRRADRGEIRPTLGGEHAGDVLEHDQARRPSLRRQKAHGRAEAPEGSGAGAVESGAGAGERQILARKRSPGEVGASGEIGGAKRGDIGYPELLTSPIGGVGRALARVDVVGEQASPLGLKSGARHAAAAKELVESGHR